MTVGKTNSNERLFDIKNRKRFGDIGNDILKHVICSYTAISHNKQFRMKLVKHFTISDRAGAIAIFLPIGRAVNNSNVARKRPFTAKEIESLRFAVDQRRNRNLSMDFVQFRKNMTKKLNFPITPACNKSFHFFTNL